MPTFIYKGMPEDMQKARIADVMNPLESDHFPTPGVGGFPLDKHGNPSQYYPDNEDSPHALTMKAKNREAYRKVRLAEAKEGIKKGDAAMSLYGVTFPKGQPVEVADTKTNKEFIAKLRYMKEMFEEAAPKPKEQPKDTVKESKK